MKTKKNVNLQLNDDGTVPHSSWPGCYPLYYVMEGYEGDRVTPPEYHIACAQCVNETQYGIDEDIVATQEANYEDPQLWCDYCGHRIPSAYAEDDVPPALVVPPPPTQPPYPTTPNPLADRLWHALEGLRGWFVGLGGTFRGWR